jgi:serine/threonine protein kinase
MDEFEKISIPTVINNEYFIDVNNYLGKGSFGYVFGAHDKAGNKYAAKFEMKNEFSLLPYERNILIAFKDKVGFPKVYSFKEQDGYYILIEELLGLTIENIFEKLNRLFSIKTVAILGLQMLSRLRVMHDKGFVHRDVKPENV